MKVSQTIIDGYFKKSIIALNPLFVTLESLVNFTVIMLLLLVTGGGSSVPHLSSILPVESETELLHVKKVSYLMQIIPMTLSYGHLSKVKSVKVSTILYPEGTSNLNIFSSRLG